MGCQDGLGWGGGGSGWDGSGRDLNEVSNDVKYSIAFDCDLTSDDDVSSISSQQSSLLSWDITEDYPVNPVSDSQI